MATELTESHTNVTTESTYSFIDSPVSQLCMRLRLLLDIGADVDNTVTAITYGKNGFP